LSGNILPQIPKIIHYAWLGGGVIPENDKKCIESWRKFCPDYEIKRWDESNYDTAKNVYMKEAYQSRKWGFVSDFLRLDVVYNYGGIYFDTDVELVRNIDELLHNEAYAGFEIAAKNTVYVNFGLGFGAVAAHPTIKKIMDTYTDLHFIKSDGSLNLVTCPIYQTRVLQQLGLSIENKIQNMNGFVIYPTEYFCPLNCCTGEINITDNTYSIHHYSASWMSEADRERRFLRKKYYKLFGRLGSEIASTIVAYSKYYGIRAGVEIVKKLYGRKKR
jgi:mannosyltransferase OCH1-like enzyme